MTPGDLAGMEEKPKEPPKPKTPRELKIDEWKGKIIGTAHSAVVFGFIEANRDAVLEVIDTRSPKQERGVLLKRNGGLAVKVGNNIRAISFRNNDDRFRLTDESAVLLGEYEFKGALAEAELAIIASTRGFLKDWRKPEESEAKVEKKEETFSSLLRKILTRRRVGYIVHVRGSEKLIESVYYKCSEREARSLKDLGRKEYLPMYDQNGVAEVLLNDDESEADLVNLLKNVGYDRDYCMPAKVTIDKKGVQFYPPDPQI